MKAERAHHLIRLMVRRLEATVEALPIEYRKLKVNVGEVEGEQSNRQSRRDGPRHQTLLDRVDRQQRMRRL